VQKNGKTFLYLWKWNSVWSQCYIKFIFGSFILSQPHTTLSAVQSPNSTGKLVGYFLQLFNWVVSSSSSSSTNFIATQVLNKTSGPLRVTYYTTAVMSMLLWPIVCIAVWSAEQFRLQCTLECPRRQQRRDRRRQRIRNLCRGNGEGAIADGPVQRPWNMPRQV